MESLIDYSRQSEFDATLQGIQKNQINYIVGCGGVGFWLATILAMQGQENFVLIDGQAIERTNLNRLPVPPSWVGINKAIALRRVIRTMRPVTAIRTITEHITEDTFDVLLGSGSYLTSHNKRHSKTVWDCTDDGRIQKKIFKALKEAKTQIKYRKLGYEGFQVGSYKEYDVWLPSDYAPGYRTSNACAATSALAAVIGIVSEGLNVIRDVEVNVKDLVADTPLAKLHTVGGGASLQYNQQEAVERATQTIAGGMAPPLTAGMTTGNLTHVRVMPRDETVEFI